MKVGDRVTLVSDEQDYFPPTVFRKGAQGTITEVVYYDGKLDGAEIVVDGYAEELGEDPKDYPADVFQLYFYKSEFTVNE